MTIVLASNNAHKVREFSEILTDIGLDIQPQSNWSVPQAQESAPTFVENAIIKARNAAHYTRLPALADDSGLEVDALGGAPGVYSARYAGVDGDTCDRANLDKLMQAMEGVAEHQRGARFVCVLVFMRGPEDATPLICQGLWYGRIARAATGTQGFGYDPILYLPDHGRSVAELAPAVKNQISHRAKAMAQLKQSLALYTRNRS